MPPAGRLALVLRDDGSTLEPTAEREWADWVAASATRNWCRKDALLDWLHLHGRDRGFVRDDELPGYDRRYDFTGFVLDQGVRFEKAVVSYLARSAPVTTIETAVDKTRSLAAADATWAAMARGDAIISQGVLRDPEARTHGAPDLLMRSDVLATLVPGAFSDAGDDAPSAAAPAFGGAPWHYRVVDIKYTTLHLLANGELSPEHVALMAQAWVYNRALGRLQGFLPPASYLLGRSWQQGTTRGRSCIERLGRVEHSRRIGRRGPTLKDVVTRATEWVRRMRIEGHDWNVVPTPSVPELWPNMKLADSAPWCHAKSVIAAALKDLTLVWNVGPEARWRAHIAGVTRFSDPRATAAMLGVRGRRARVVDAILDVNHEDALTNLHLPATGAWQDAAALELFVDFETVSDLADDFAAIPQRGGQPLIFQIGCGRVHNNRWDFRQFTVASLTPNAELDVLRRWLRHIESLAREVGVSFESVRVFHWSPAEPNRLYDAYDSARKRHPSEEWPRLSWFDLLHVIQTGPLAVRGALSFGLKEIARALYDHRLIATRWEDGPMDGLGAMVAAWASQAESGPLSLEHVGAYNETDCRVMSEIIAYLRTAMSGPPNTEQQPT